MSRKVMSKIVMLLVIVLLTACRASGQPAVAPQATVNSPITMTAIPAESRFDCTVVSEIPTAECAALADFYTATQGDQWVNNDGWLESNTPCSWAGVSCVDGHVDMLALFFNGLQGQLPASVASLSRLRVLDLHNNTISGPLPEALGQMNALEGLDLSGNQLQGLMPMAWGKARALQSLSLAHNELSGPIPDDLGNLTSLRILDLSYNQIEGALPATLGNLQALEALRLSNNRLQGEIPFAVSQLPALSEVDLAFNDLVGVVPSALQLLPVHRLWGNNLDGTIRGVQGEKQQVNFLGAAFTFDGATTDSVWAELVPARAAQEGPGMPWSSPEHIEFTLVRDTGAQDHFPLGLYLPPEAQIHVYPTAQLNVEARAVVDGLKALLAEQADPALHEMTTPTMDATPAGLTMLPPTNAQQTLRAQVQYLEFSGGRGVRFLTQLSQGLAPINNQELFYTFQGLTDDGGTYVGAYFPVSLPALPPTAQIGDEAFGKLLEDWDGYLAETVALLNEQETAAYTPDLAALDALISTLSLSGSKPLPEIEGVWPDNGESVDGQPVLQWAAFAGATQYEVVVVDDDDYPPQAVISEYTAETTLAVTPALAPGSYSWTVRALDGDNAVLAELNRAFFVKDTMELVAPQTGDAVTPSPLLQWQPYVGATTYQVLVVDDSAYPPVVLLDEKTSETALQVSAALEPGSYSWSVWALNDADVVVAELNSQFLVEAP